MKEAILRILTCCLLLGGLSGLGGVHAAMAAEVEFRTTLGTMRIEVYEDKAPESAKNFIQYVKDGFYDGLIFHRVIPNFVVQGGGFDGSMQKRRTRAPILNEANNGLKNLQYTLSMARTSDPHSATSQFFINLRNNTSLDFPSNGGYAVFGKVVEGMDVVDKIARVPTGTVGRYQDVPLQQVEIKKAVVLSE